MIFLRPIILLFYFLIFITNGEDYKYAFFEVGVINVYVDINKTFVVTTLEYGQNTYPKPQDAKIDYGIFEIYSSRDITYEYLFDQFLIGSNEYLRFIDSINGDYYKRADDIIHRGTHAYHRTSTSNATTVFGYDKTMAKDYFNHTGIKVIVRERNPSRYWCSIINGNKDITIDKEPYFLLSYSYPDIIPTNGSCTFNVNSNSQYIKVFIYDFRLNLNNEYVSINGQLVNSSNADGVNSQKLTGYLTSDLPVTFYYKGNINIFVSQINGMDNSKFFIKITPYNVTTNPGNSNCINDGDSRGIVITPTTFGLRSFFNKSFYEPNEICSWNFKELPNDNYKYLFRFEFESEYGCDTLTMNGFGQDSNDIWVYQGFQPYKYVYARNTTGVSLKWTSDGVQNGIGFIGDYRIQECSCTNVNGVLSDTNSNVSIYSPGYNIYGLPYCPDVSCNWIFTFDPTKEYVLISFDEISLRMPLLFSDDKTNTITISNKFKRTINSITATSNFKTNSTQIYSSSGALSISWKADKNNVFDFGTLNNGFLGYVSKVSIPNFLSVRNVELTSLVPYSWVVESTYRELIKITCVKGPIKIIPQSYFITSDLFIDIFKDSVSPENLIDNSYLYTTDAYSKQPTGIIINSTTVYIRIYKVNIDVKVKYNFFVSDLGSYAINNNGNEPYYENIPTTQPTTTYVLYLKFFNALDINNSSSTDGMLIETNKPNISIYGENHSLLSYNGAYPKYYFGNTIGLSAEGISRLITLTPTIIPDTLNYTFFDNSEEKFVIYSKDYMNSQPNQLTSMKFLFLESPRTFQLVITDFRGSGKIHITVYNEEDIYNQKVMTLNDKHVILCGTRILLNYYTNNVYTNATGFIGYVQISEESCTPKKDTSSSSLSAKVSAFLLMIVVLSIMY
uniref:CUB domain-containing protein n=1 Tax=Parastrongyloides trichosuri TaxID=131310 RepID=A0A0N5A3E1_PARTI